LSFCTHVSKSFSIKADYIEAIKAKQSLFYTYGQVSSALKVGFYPKKKTGIMTIHRL